MQVGVWLSKYSPELGGNYTFEHELLSSLVKQHIGSRHTFQIFARVRRRGGIATTERLTPVWLDRQRELGERIGAGCDFARQCLSSDGRKRLQQRGKHPWIERVLRRSGVEIMWYLSHSVVTHEIPYIATVLDLQHRLQPFFPEVSAGAEWERRDAVFASMLRRATAIVTGTAVGKAEIERFYNVPSERIRTLPHPTPRFALVPPTDDDRPLLARFGLAPGYLLYPAQFWPHKNHAGLLQALKILKDDFGLTPKLALAGSDYGNHQAYIRQLAVDLGLAEQVHFLGFVSQRELVALYRSALATTYVTYFGPENLPPLESFALGCPVVASRVAGAEEQLGDAAILVDPRQPQEIAQAIHSLAQDPAQRRKLIDKGAKRAGRFTGDDFVAGVLQILDDFEQIRSCWGRKAA